MRAERLARTTSTRCGRVSIRPGLRTIVIAALLCACFVCATPAWSAITKVDVANKTDRVVITVCGDSALQMSPLISKSGSYVGFQFPCALATKGRLVGIRGGGIYNVRISSFRANPPLARIVANTTGHRYYATNWSADRRRVEISVMKAGYQVPKPEVKVKASVQEVTNTGTPGLISGAVEVKSIPVALKAEPAPAPKPEAKPIFVAMNVEPKPVVQPVVVAQKAEPKPEAKPVVVAQKAEPKPEAKPVVVAQKAEPKPLVRVASADPKAVAGMASAPKEPAAWAPNRNISLNFLAADINDVLKALAVQSGQNIVSSKDVKGNVTVSLNKVSIDEAMDYVAKLSGYSYTKDNGTYLVAAKDSLGALTGSVSSKPVVEVVPISYTKTDDVVGLIKAQFPGLQVAKINKASIEQGESGGAAESQSLASTDSKIVLSGDADVVAAAKAVAAQVDSSMKGQIVGQTSEVYRVKYVKPQDLANTLSTLIPGITVYAAPQEGFDLPAPSAITLSNSGAAVATSTAGLEKVATVNANAEPLRMFDPKSKTRTIVIVGRAEDVEKALALASSVDVKSPQIKIDAKITSVTATGEKNLGLSWEWDKIAFFETGVEAWKRGATNFAATLDALITSGDGQLLASPSLVCLEGKPGVFFVGQEVTYIQRIEVTATGQNITTDTKQVGVQLRVNGTANLDGYVTLNLHPEVSVLKLSAQQGITLPIVTRRFTDHVVRVKSGQTIVIGGLISNEDIVEMSKVPLLGDIPLLGKLFRHQYTTKDRTEVVMFITATVLSD